MMPSRSTLMIASSDDSTIAASRWASLCQSASIVARTPSCRRDAKSPSTPGRSDFLLFVDLATHVPSEVDPNELSLWQTRESTQRDERRAVTLTWMGCGGQNPRF